jgi:hypothetical protein
MRTSISRFRMAFVKIAVSVCILAPAVASAQDGASCLAALQVEKNLMARAFASGHASNNIDECIPKLVEMKKELQIYQLWRSVLDRTNAACINDTVTGRTTAGDVNSRIASSQRRINVIQDRCTRQEEAEKTDGCMSGGSACLNANESALKACLSRCTSDSNCYTACDTRSRQQIAVCAVNQQTCMVQQRNQNTTDGPKIPEIGCFGVCSTGKSCNFARHICE